MFNGNEMNHDENYDSYYELDNDLNFIKGLSMLAVAYGFQQNLFPMQNSLKEPTNKNSLDAVKLAMGATTVVYISIALLGLFFFGSVVD